MSKIQIVNGRPRMHRRNRRSFGVLPALAAIPPLVLGALGLGLWLLFKGGSGGSSVDYSYSCREEFIDMMDRVLTSLGVSQNARVGIITMAGLETGFGMVGSSKSGQTNNFWNVTKGGWGGPTIDGADRDANGNPIQQKWRVYTNPSQAAQDYLGLLSIKAGMPYLDAGDYYQFVMLIHSMGYFELDPTEYYSRFAAILPSTKSVLGVL